MLERLHYNTICNLLAALTLVHTVTCCIHGELYENACYETVQDPKNYRSAGAYCKSIGGQLADAKNSVFLQNVTDKLQEGTYYLRSNSSYSSENSSLCLVIRSKSQEIEQIDCETKEYFICETPSEASTYYCKQGYYRYKNVCLKGKSTLVSYNDAVTFCTLLYGRVATLNNLDKQEFIASINLMNSPFWANVKKVNDTFKWSSGEIFNTNCESCKNSTSEGQCVILSLNPFQWNVEYCSTKASMLCEVDAEELTTQAPLTTTTVLSCPHGYHWKYHEDSGWCFWETTYETERQSWWGARSFCARFGGDLASYHNYHQEVQGIGGATAHTKGLWIGLKRSTENNTFSWSDGSIFNYSRWERNEPKMRSQTKDCVIHGDNDSRWKLDYCGVRRWFVCKAPLTSNPIMPDLIVENKTRCQFSTDSRFREWYLHGEHCYMIAKSTTFSWDTAKTFCQDNGAHLASIRSFSETDFILSLGTGKADVQYWIGGSAIGLHSPMSWSDGSPVDFVYWVENDEFVDLLQRDDRNCIAFNDRDGSWLRSHCNKFLGAICKRSKTNDHVFSTPTPTPITPGYCPNETYTLGNKCYKIMGKDSPKYRWQDAKLVCQNMGATLLSIHSQKEQEFVTDLVLELGEETWIGLRARHRGNIYHWEDDSPMYYTNWAESEPETRTNTDVLCVTMKYSNSDMGMWSTDACLLSKPFICQLPRDLTITKPFPDPFLCPDVPDWMKIGSSCYGIFDDPDDRTTWLQAQASCRQLDSNLMSVKNFGITLFLKSKLSGKDDVFWIGVRETSENKYQALNDQQLTYSNWLVGQPQHISRLRNCVAVDVTGKWMVRNCEEKHSYVCEQSLKDEIHGNVIEIKSESCPKYSDKWTDFKGNRCFLINGDELPIFSAANYCFRYGGSLASFHSEEDIRNIISYKGTNFRGFYIGLGKLADGSLGWRDGSPLDFTYWDLSEPSESGSCVMLMTTTGRWRMSNCIMERPFICSTPKVSNQEFDPIDIAQALNSTTENENVRRSLKIGGILGIVICVAVLLAIAGVASYYLCPATRMRTRLRSESESQ